MMHPIEDNDTDPRMKLRPNTGDKLHDLQLLRDQAIINARTACELGPLPPDGLPVLSKRKPDLPLPPESLAVKEDDMNPLQRIAAATTLAASTLAACGDARPPEQSAEAAPAPAVPTPAPVPAPAPSAPNPPPVVAPKPVVEVAEVEIKRGPAIPAATLRKQVLALLDSLQSLEDLEREHVEAIFRVHLTKEPEVRDGYEYFGQTTEGWTYYINVIRLHALSDPPKIMIALNNGVEPWTDQKPTYCTLDFEELAKDIVGLGYERAARRMAFGGKPSWGFGKDIPSRNAGLGIGVYLYYLNEGTESERACVKEFHLSGDVLNG